MHPAEMQALPPVYMQASSLITLIPVTAILDIPNQYIRALCSGCVLRDDIIYTYDITGILCSLCNTTVLHNALNIGVGMVAGNRFQMYNTPCLYMRPFPSVRLHDHNGYDLCIRTLSRTQCYLYRG